MPIINSLLDSDSYKFSMQQFVLHQFPAVTVRYKFKCRTLNIDLSSCVKRIQDEINCLDQLRFKDEELWYLGQLGFLTQDYIDFLGIFRLNSKYVTVTEAGDITIEGPWLHTILYEIYILKIVNEVYFDMFYPLTKEMAEEGSRRLRGKIEDLKGTDIKFADFGTRRAYSGSWHDKIINYIVSTNNFPNFIGTSNIMLASRYGCKCIGTMAHEIFQVCQSLTRIADSQKFALQKWADEYRGDLGIALSDTLGIDYLLRHDFDKYFSLLFQGLRHDSGNPYIWTNKIVEHYEKMGIDPTTKTAVYSDGLTVESMLAIELATDKRIKCAFGWGTDLTNDLGPKALQIVIKVIEANGQPVIKLSDSPGKAMCEDESYEKYVREIIKK